MRFCYSGTKSEVHLQCLQLLCMQIVLFDGLQSPFKATEQEDYGINDVTVQQTVLCAFDVSVLEFYFSELIATAYTGYRSSPIKHPN